VTPYEKSVWIFLSSSKENHSLLQEEASIPTRLAAVDDGISLARTFIELFACQAL
jgi:hypothetical protein